MFFSFSGSSRTTSEEGMMLHTDLPQPLGGPVVLQLEAHRGLEVFKLSRSDLDEESVSLVGNLYYLGPGEPVDPQPVPVDEDAGGADPQHDVHGLRVPGRVEAHTVHGELLSVVKIM